MGIKKRRSRASGKRKRVHTGTGENSGASAESSGAASGEGTGARTGEGTGEGTEAQARGSVGILPEVRAGLNPVEVDAAKIEADMAAVAAAADGAPASAQAAPDSYDAEPPPSSWAHITPGIVQVFDVFVCPNWNLRSEERTALEESLTPVLDDLFPGGAGNARWAPYFRLAFVAGGVVLSRLDRETMKLPPLRLKPEDEKARAKAAADRDAADETAERGAALAAGLTA